MSKRIISILLAAVLAVTLSAPVFAATLNSSQAKAVYRIVNEERQKAGLDPLVWDADLVEAAEIRVEEITRKYTSNHTRPDGSSYTSVSTAVWSENTAYGQPSAERVMSSWMDSKGHKENILRTNHTTIGVGAAMASDGNMYWVQVFGTGKSNASWAGVKSYTLDPFADGGDSKSADNAQPSGTAALMNSEGVVSASGLAAAVKKATGNTVLIQNARSISPEAFQAAATAVPNKTVLIQVDTTSSTGKTVQGSMILEPARLGNRKGAINPGVYTTSASVSDVKAAAEKRYSSDMAYIHMAHSGTLTTMTTVKARLNLEGMNTEALRLYVYDKSSGTFSRLENAQPSYESGVLTFYTKTAGDIVVTDANLK